VAAFAVAAFVVGAFFAGIFVAGAAFEVAFLVCPVVDPFAAEAFLAGEAAAASAGAFLVGVFVGGDFAASTALTGDVFLSAGFFAADFLTGAADAVTVALRVADEAAGVVRLCDVGDRVDPGTVGGVLGDTNNLS